MKREELLRSVEFWLANIQNDLYAIIENYRIENNLKKKDIAEKLGVSKGYITQILKGDFDHKISKLVEIALAFDKAPIFNYQDLEKYIQQDLINETTPLVYKNVEINKGELNFDVRQLNIFLIKIKDLETLTSGPVSRSGSTNEYSKVESLSVIYKRA